MIANYQKKQIAVQLKKAYSTFAQALVSSQYENGNSSEWTLTEPSSSYDDNLAYFNNYWKPYLKILKTCKTMSECGYNISGYSVLNNDNFVYYGQDSNVPGFVFEDGSYAYIRPYSKNLVYVPTIQLLSIDINGPKRPNMIGRDVFQFQIDMSKGVIAGYGNKNDCVKDKIYNSNNQELPRTCGGKIMSDGWEIKDDYPW